MLCCAPAGFNNLSKDLEKSSDEWYNWCLHETPERVPMPGDWCRSSEFKQLLLLRALRPDRVTNALQRFCEAAMGARYINQEAFSPAVVMEESTRWGWQRHHWDKRGMPQHQQILLTLLPCQLSGAVLYVSQRCYMLHVSQAGTLVKYMCLLCVSPACSATPIFFILFPGYSPSKEIEAYACKHGKTVEAGNLTLISMGQRQEGPAEAVLDK